jgi:hypothetical protein
MFASFQLTDLAHTIQLAVAPVFLLTALGTILSVLSGRLSRIVDRARLLCDRLPGLDHSAARSLIDELKLLGQRRKLVNYALTCATLAALLVCVLIAMAFLGFIVAVNFAMLIAALFIAAMTAFVLALIFFLREVLLAAASINLGPSDSPAHD